MSFEFFRKYQRVILWSAGIFALLTFAISGSLYALIDRIDAKPFVGPTMIVGGEEVQVTQDDDLVARKLVAARDQGMLAVMLPMSDRVVPSDSAVPLDRDASRNPVDRFAALRRIAIHQGLGLSFVEADKAIAKAIEFAQELSDGNSPAKDARSYASLFGMPTEELRRLVAESVRIGTWARLALLGVQRGDATIAEYLGRYDDDDLLTFKAAMLDENQLLKGLEEGQEPSEEVLRAWLAGEEEYLDEGEEAPSIFEKQRRGIVDPALGQAKFFGLLYDGFVAAEWEAELADLPEITQASREATYNRWKDDLFKLPEDGDAKDGDGTGTGDGGDDDAAKKDDTGGDDTADDGADDGADDQEAAADDGEQQPAELAHRPVEECTEELDRILKTTHVMRKLTEQIRAARDAVVAELDEEIKRLNEKGTELAKRQRDAQQAYNTSGTDEDSRDPMLKAALDAATEAATENSQKLQELREQRTERQREFDSVAKFQELTEGKSGTALYVMPEPQSQDKMQQLEVFGRWPNSFSLTMQTSAKGDIGNSAQEASKGAFLFETIFTDRLPIKPFDVKQEPKFSQQEVKEEDKKLVGEVVLDWYLDSKAKLRGDAKAEEMDETLERMVRELKPEEFAEIESKVDVEVGEELAEWSAGLEEEIAKGKKILGRIQDTQSRAHRDWTKKVKDLEGQLAASAAKEKELRTAAEERRDEAIEELVREHLSEVLEAAAQEVGYEIITVGPARRAASRETRFSQKYSRHVGAIWRFVVARDPSGVEPGKGYDQLRDPVERVRYVPVCTEVQEVDQPRLTRRRLMAMRNIDPGNKGTDGQPFSEYMFNVAAVRSFTLDALKARYNWESPGQELNVPANGAPSRDAEAQQDDGGNAGAGNDGSGDGGEK